MHTWFEYIIFLGYMINVESIDKENVKSMYLINCVTDKRKVKGIFTSCYVEYDNTV